MILQLETRWFFSEAEQNFLEAEVGFQLLIFQGCNYVKCPTMATRKGFAILLEIPPVGFSSFAEDADRVSPDPMQLGNFEKGFERNAKKKSRFMCILCFWFHVYFRGIFFGRLMI